jgi:hypothetical protein
LYIPPKRPVAYVTGSKLLSLTEDTRSSSLINFDEGRERHQQLKKDVEGVE